MEGYEANAYWEAFGPDIMAAHKLAWHLHCRRHHKPECQCDQCKSDGKEECSQEKPCASCLKYLGDRGW